MNRPDPGSPDQGANQDDAIWLDLVARLEGKSPAEPGAPEDGPAEDDGTPPAAGRAATFRDFDPLGLAGAAPTELSAAERHEASTAGRSPDAPAADGNAAGPRDYEEPEDAGEFIPEEPPSLAGTDPLTMLAWLAAVGGPVALLLSAMFWRSAPLLAVVGIVAVFVLGTVYLIMKLPQEKDDNDDGARV
ncbi:conserved hypothetical protein [Arthrobacter sp. 9AX]|uniref:hypothetical protein n=1 Tax=Arthrobacter sp. 9AX TaxID=2653131 RepID=UPI0012F0165C|nr:hypothetical protein [Arthrobacter sp. 9AX]VXB11343.1 conserved hypothetical protein [Arthrobacter sp. 9AX]